MSTPEAKNLKSDLARKFPALQVLNGEQVQTMQFGLPLVSIFLYLLQKRKRKKNFFFIIIIQDVVDAPLLPKEQENFFDQESTQDATITFARRYLYVLINVPTRKCKILRVVRQAKTGLARGLRRQCLLFSGCCQDASTPRLQGSPVSRVCS